MHLWPKCISVGQAGWGGRGGNEFPEREVKGFGQDCLYRLYATAGVCRAEWLLRDKQFLSST